jgi:hypothetical protein
MQSHNVPVPTLLPPLGMKPCCFGHRLGQGIVTVLTQMPFTHYDSIVPKASVNGLSLDQLLEISTAEALNWKLRPADLGILFSVVTGCFIATGATQAPGMPSVSISSTRWLFLDGSLAKQSTVRGKVPFAGRWPWREEGERRNSDREDGHPPTGIKYTSGGGSFFVNKKN